MTMASALLLAFTPLALGDVRSEGHDLARWVDPFIGTGGHGHTFPGPVVPFGMIQPGPDTRLTGWDGCSGYHDTDNTLFGFSHTHLSGTGVSDYGDVLLLPATGSVRLHSGYERPPGDGYGSRFRKETEHAEAGYYRVRLDDYGIDAELTTTTRTGWHRYTFPGSDSAHILVDLTHRDAVLESWVRVVDENTIEGMRRSQAWATDQPVYFVLRTSKPFTASLFADDRLQTERRVAGLDVKAVLRFSTLPGEQVLVKVALSAVDSDGARRNLDADPPGWDFDATRAAARAAWNEALSRLEVDGGTDAQRTVFYTALYHTLLQPYLFQDADGRYLGMDRQVHQAVGYTRYTVFSLWDTFRAAHPLYALIERARSADFVRTFLEMYRESGRLPVWELWGNETDCMIGYHAVPVIVDAWVKGIRAFDPDLALAAMKAAAEADRSGLAAYRKHGYIPADVEGESVSRTLEYGYDDFCIATFAGALGHEADRETYLRRSAAWRHLLGPDGFLRPRANGRWVTPFDPYEVTFHFTEANAWQYRFFVPHDIAGLAERLGGHRAVEAALDALFAADSRTRGREQADITGLAGQYAHGNEPSHHMAYLYALAGAPHKTQAMVHHLVDTMYRAAPDGLAGNEDCGQMSAWLVWSALGLYPVTPGMPDYVLGTPLFERATVRLENGRTFTIRTRRQTAGAFYVQGAALNGRPHLRATLTHDDLLAGGELVFDLGAEPSPWGATTEPVRRIDSAVERIVPAPVAEGPEVFVDIAEIRLLGADPADALFYTLDGTEPYERSDRYASPLRVATDGSVTFRARRGTDWSPTVVASWRRIDPRLRLTLRTPIHPQYRAGGELALIDGLRGGDDFRLGTWQGYYGVDLDADLDLGESREVRRVAVGFLHDQNSWIFLPLELRVSLSDDGEHWSEAGTAVSDLDPRYPSAAVREFAVAIPPTHARHVRIHAASPIVCPEWHKGAGNKAFLFADEILVE
jgi:predicted alpha-1,2-mannosidase